MRRREDLEETPPPRPCNHPPATHGRTTAPACQWGYSARHPLPLDAPADVLAVMEQGRRDHLKWEGLRLVPRPELLTPDGKAWERRPVCMTGHRPA